MSYGQSTMDRRRFLWDWIDEHYPEAFKDPGYPGLRSPALRAKAVAALAEHLGIRAGASRKSNLTAAVKGWLNNPDRYSPHVDEIALELALGFDWGAINCLSLAEYGVLLDRLDGMRDPFDVDTEDRTTDGSAPRGGKRLVDASRRRLAYLRGPSKQRYRLAASLERRRVRAALVAA